MDKVLPHTEFRVIDLNAQWMGKSILELMEAAGRAVAQEIISRYPGKSVAVLCGTGNNGGDGFVCARYLLKAGFKVEVFALGEPKTREARLNLERLGYLTEVTRISSPEELELKTDVVVDALLGTGIKGDLREPYRGVIEKLQKFAGAIVAVDLPSGMNSQGGGFFAKPELVVTFVARKPGLENLNTVVRQIGMPEEAITHAGAGDVLVCTGIRKKTAHKGNFGRVLIIGGSSEYHGAPALSALAALKAGADLVYLLVPEYIAQAVRAISPELIVVPYHARHLTRDALAQGEALLQKVDCVVIGPGLGIHEETKKAVQSFLQSWKGKLVVDADALKVMSGLKLKSREAVLTPHFREAEHLAEAGESREEIALRIAQKYRAVALLKGSVDVIASPDGRVKMNKTGNAGMTSGGTGDVLSGIVAAFLCQGGDPFYAATGAAFLNGYAGDRLFEKKRYFFTAHDLLEEIPLALGEIYTRLKM